MERKIVPNQRKPRHAGAGRAARDAQLTETRAIAESAGQGGRYEAAEVSR